MGSYDVDYTGSSTAAVGWVKAVSGGSTTDGGVRSAAVCRVMQPPTERLKHLTMIITPRLVSTMILSSNTYFMFRHINDKKD